MEIIKYFNLSKEQILEDMESGIIPKTVKTFSELHDYVDANWYGGFTQESYEHSENFEFENSVQELINKWLESR